MAKEWSESEDAFSTESPIILGREIHALAACSRTLSARFNVRELIAPMLFLGVSQVSAEALFSAMRALSDARKSLASLEEKIFLLLSELSLASEGGVA